MREMQKGFEMREMQKAFEMREMRYWGFFDFCSRLVIKEIG